MREINNSTYKILRITISKWYKKINQIFDIHNLIILNKKNKKISKFSETHKMRYFNLQQIKKKLLKIIFKFLESFDLQQENQLTLIKLGSTSSCKKIIIKCLHRKKSSNFIDSRKKIWRSLSRATLYNKEY